MPLFQMFLCIQRKFDHPFKKFVCLQPREIVLNDLLAKQAANITQLAFVLFAGIYKIPVPVIDDNR